MENAKKKISHITDIDVSERELGNEDAFLGKLEIFEMRLLASSFLPVRPSHSQQTNIHASGGIRTQNLSSRATADLRLKPRGHWNRRF